MHYLSQISNAIENSSRYNIHLFTNRSNHPLANISTEHLYENELKSVCSCNKNNTTVVIGRLNIYMMGVYVVHINADTLQMPTLLLFDCGT